MIISLIRENVTGTIKKKKHDFDYNEFVWNKGNFSCDCNRSIFFHDKDIDESCGYTKYSVNIEDLKGQILYQEF